MGISREISLSLWWLFLTGWILTSCCDQSLLCRHTSTWNPNDHSFGLKRPCFGGLTFKNRGHLGYRYISWKTTTVASHYALFPKDGIKRLKTLILKLSSYSKYICNPQNGSQVGGFNPLEKYARPMGNLPQIGVKIKHTWNHHLVVKWPSCVRYVFFLSFSQDLHSCAELLVTGKKPNAVSLVYRLDINNNARCKIWELSKIVTPNDHNKKISSVCYPQW